VIRVYVNGFNEGKIIWSVDEGDTSTERKVENVMILGVTGIAAVNMNADNKIEPKAWIQFYNAQVVVDKGIAIVREK